MDRSEFASLQSADGLRALRELLGSMVHRQPTLEELRSALRPVCEQARRDDLDAAALVKLVKRSYVDGETSRRGSYSPERQQTLDRIISVCIDQYYALGQPPRNGEL